MHRRKEATGKSKSTTCCHGKKLEAVRRWSPIVQQQFREASVRLVHFQERLDSDLPKGLARLERMVRSLDSYREVSSPVGGSSPEGGATGPRVTRSLDEAPARRRLSRQRQSPSLPNRPRLRSREESRDRLLAKVDLKIE